MTTVADKLAPRLARPLFDWDVPESERDWETDPTSFTLQQPTTLQDIDAAGVADFTKPTSYLLARLERSVVMLSGKPADQGTPFLDSISPRVRELMFEAFQSITQPTKEGRAAFLASAKKRAG